MAKKNNMIKINKDKFDDWCRQNNVQMTEMSRNFGLGDAYFSHASNRGSLPLDKLKLLDVVYGNTDYFVLKEEAKVENITEEKETYNLDEINKKLGELEGAINKLGNIQMQSMEYLQKIAKSLDKQCEYMGLRR